VTSEKQKEGELGQGSSRVPPEQLETPRLRLCRLTTEHAGAIFQGWAQDEEVTRYLHWRPHQDSTESIEHAERCEASWKDGSSFTWVLEELGSGEIIGSIAAHDSGFRVGLGYVIARARWGEGFAPEAVRAVSEWFLQRPETFRVWAVCDVDNRASARVLEKAGFALEGTLRRWMMHPNVSDHPRDALCYSLLRKGEGSGDGAEADVT
jgi:RimJ/RimL family protein N-acetyltransferase